LALGVLTGALPWLKYDFPRQVLYTDDGFKFEAQQDDDF
jgi:hypothetical protein